MGAGKGEDGREGEREGTVDGRVWGAIIKVTHTPLNGSRLDHRQAGAMPPSDTKGCGAPAEGVTVDLINAI